MLSNNNSQTLWSTGTKTVNAAAQLLDNGNFVLKGEDSTDFVWQSFDFPADTLLPEMKMGPDYKHNRNRNLTSWTNQSDPSSGQYTYKMDDKGAGQPYLIRNGSTVVFRSGPWNGLEFSGHHRMRSFQDLTFTVVHNENESYYQYWVTDNSTLARLVVEISGNLTRYGWDEGLRDWKRRWSTEDSICDNYAQCGPNSVCNSGSSSLCKCLEGFQVRNPQHWKDQIWREGCERRANLTCSGDGFLQKSRMKLPDTMNATINGTIGFDQCEGTCLRDCSCVAYAPADIADGDSGCIFWSGNLVDMRNFSDGGQNLYLRLEKGDLGEF